MPYIILDKQPEKEGFTRIARSLYFCPPSLLKEFPEGLSFLKGKVRKYRLQQRRKRVGYILIWYHIEKNAERNRKIMNRMISHSLGFPLAPSLYAFPYIQYPLKTPFIPPQKIYSRATQLGISISKMAVLTPLGKTKERMKDHAERYMRRRYEQLIRRILKANAGDRKTRSEIKQDFKTLKQKSRMLSVILTIDVQNLERKTYTLLSKWMKVGQTPKAIKAA
jgi:hypothetical protein